MSGEIHGGQKMEKKVVFRRQGTEVFGKRATKTNTAALSLSLFLSHSKETRRECLSAKVIVLRPSPSLLSLSLSLTHSHSLSRSLSVCCGLALGQDTLRSTLWVWRTCAGFFNHTPNQGCQKAQALSVTHILIPIVNAYKRLHAQKSLKVGK